MRSFCLIALSILVVTASANVWAQTDEGGDDADDLFGSSNAQETETEETPANKTTSSSSEMVMDEEGPQTDSSGKIVDANFVSLGGTSAWLDRNGLGAHVGIGGFTCSREYCNTTLDASILGSIALTLGAYYKLNPNWSLFADITIARLNTNYRQNTLDGNVGDNHGVAFQIILGPAFHLPVKGWLDLYTTLGIGPIALREKTDVGIAHHWGGFDIEWGLGADFYFWSVGPLKNFSIGPFMKIGFPIWPKVCAITADGQENCQKPSDMHDLEFENNVHYWDETPFTFQLGIEARLEFTMGGKDDDPKVDSKEAPKKDTADDDTTDENSEDQSDENAINAATGDDDDAEAEGSASGAWDM